MFVKLANPRIAADRISFNALISACEKVRQWQQSLAFMRHMREKQMHPDIFSFSAAISSCQSEQWQWGVRLFQDMLKLKIRPNIISLNAMLSLWEKSGQWQHALSWFASMRPSFQISPDILSFNSLMGSLGSGLEWQRSLLFFQEMRRSKDLRPDVVSFNTVIHLLSRCLDLPQMLPAWAFQQIILGTKHAKRSLAPQIWQICYAISGWIMIIICKF